MRRMLLLLLPLLMLSCVKDDLWREHYSKTYTAGSGITVSADSIATITGPQPGYLTIVSSHYYTNGGDLIYNVRAGLEVMHNVQVNVRVGEGDPNSILILNCTIGGLASRFDISHTTLLGPSASVTALIIMQGCEGSTLFRLLGPADEHQSLALDVTLSNGREQQVTADVTDVLHNLRPTPFRLSAADDLSTIEHVEIETTVDIDIELRLPDPADTEATVTAALTGWRVNEEDVNAY